jgi:hypothetical protein
VAYRDCSTHKQLRKDVTYEGRAKVLKVGKGPKDSDPVTGTMAHRPLDNGEVWHLDKRACYTFTQGDNLNSPNTINPLPTQDVYLVTGRDEEGCKIKTTLEQILTIEEDMCPTEQFRLAFIKRNENSRLYQAQMFRSCINSIKENAWVRDYGVDLEKVRKLHLSMFAHSKVKGFMWLWCSHALPAGTRLRSKDANTACPHCGEVEDIRPITANNIWVEFNSTIRARLNHIKAKANWWTYRDAVQLVPKAIAKQNLEDIEVEQSILLALLPLGAPRVQPSGHVGQARELRP